MLRRSRRFKFWVLGIAVALLCAGCLWVPGGPGSSPSSAPSSAPPLPLGHSGRWFTDAFGRVVLLHGVNFVQKGAPFTPAAAGFSDDDAALLQRNGFNAVRLGVVFGFLMPQPGQIDEAYLDSIIQTAQMLGRHGLYVLFDFHQDGWGSVTHGNGMPAWATFTDGLPNPSSATFPLYYIQNPALERAFDNLWANRLGPNGVPLQTYYAQGMRAVAARVADDQHVLGYEAMNEPWPGTNWSECLSGCPDLEAQLLVPFYNRMAAAVRSVDRVHPLLEEPFVLFNFGQATTSLPGATVPPGTANRVLATHDYALSADADVAVMDSTVAAAQRDGAPAVIDEFGATTDPTMIERLVNGYDDHLLPWLFWAYNEEVVFNSSQPLVPPNVQVPVLDALTRPYPTAVNGTPTKLHFDDATTTFELNYATTRPDGARAAPGLETTVSVPPRRYPNGYAVTVTGATVTSAPCAPTLSLRNDPQATTVTVQVVPASMCKGSAPG